MNWMTRDISAQTATFWRMIDPPKIWPAPYDTVVAAAAVAAGWNSVSSIWKLPNRDFS